MNEAIQSKSKLSFEVAEGVWGMKDIFVNVYMIQNLQDDNWVLVDAGLKTSISKIKKMASQLFGEESRPKAIILTHGHFDHVGALAKLIAEWNVPVYAHYLELPYLTGKSAYPPPDPSVGGGLMAYMANVYPNSPINIEGSVTALPDDESIPGLNGWRYIHTPGHAPGHVSLFRDEDKVLIAGDAFVTTKQESAIAVMLQKRKISGPPAYFTYDWNAADESVKKLLLLAPEVVATGHGKPMYGKEMRKELHKLYDNFYNMAVPSRGRYVNDPAVADVNGVMYVPPRKTNPFLKWIALGSVVALTTTAYIVYTKNKKKKIIKYNL
jgi:glyoxylase-like metal-dependent hydrolase (beta-lactamase superfamily II)